jgi:hypothetical protein
MGRINQNNRDQVTEPTDEELFVTAPEGSVIGGSTVASTPDSLDDNSKTAEPDLAALQARIAELEAQVASSSPSSAESNEEIEEGTKSYTVNAPLAPATGWLHRGRLVLPGTKITLSAEEAKKKRDRGMIGKKPKTDKPGPNEDVSPTDIVRVRTTQFPVGVSGI